MPASPLPREAPVIEVIVVQPGKAGQRLDQSHKISSLTYEDEEKKANKLTLQVDNWDLAHFDNPLFVEGNILLVRWGYVGRMCPQRECVIKKTTGSVVLSVEAFSRSTLMNQQRRSRIFATCTRSEVVRVIAQENGYSEDRQHIEDTEVVHEHIAQARMSDAQFIRHLANKEKFEFFVDHTGFHFHARQVAQKLVREYVYYLDPGQGDIIDFGVENDIFAKPKAAAATVTAAGVDPKTGKPIGATATAADGQAQKITDQIKLIDPASGLSSFGALGDMLNNKAVKEQLDGVLKNVKADIDKQAQKIQEDTNKLMAEVNASVETQGTTASDPKQAAREAKSTFRHGIQQGAKLNYRTVGDPDVQAKTVVKVTFPAKAISGRYYVQSLKDELTPGSYVQSFKCIRESNMPSGAKGAKNAGQGNNQGAGAAGELTKKKLVDKFGNVSYVYVDGGGSPLQGPVP